MQRHHDSRRRRARQTRAFEFRRGRGIAPGNLLPYGSQARSARKKLARIPYEAAYPGIEISPSSRNWWARLKGTAPECIHLRVDVTWMAALLPDTLYVRGKRALRREPARPEISICRACLFQTIAEELAAFAGRVVAFEPDAEIFTQYFFVATDDFEAVGLAPETAAAIGKRLGQSGETCSECANRAKWLWFSRAAVESLDEVEKIAGSSGEWLCAKHGAKKLLGAFEAIPEANIFYMNLPYGEAGAYVWI